MLRFIAQHRVLLLALLLVLIGLHLLSTGLRRQADVGFFGKAVLVVYTPIYKVLSWPFAKVADFFRGYIYLVDLRDTNENLRKQTAILKTQLAELQELRAENDRMKKLLGLQTSDPKPIANAWVIRRGEEYDFQVLIIDAGSHDGVQKGMAVVAPDGLVGYVAAVAFNASKVVMLTDVGARVDAILQRTRHRAMVFGSGKDFCTLEYLDPDADVAEGDRLVTSGMDGVFPKGIPVALVGAVSRADFGVVQSVIVKPTANMATIEEVAVLPKPPIDAGLMP